MLSFLLSLLFKNIETLYVVSVIMSVNGVVQTFHLYVEGVEEAITRAKDHLKTIGYDAQNIEEISLRQISSGTLITQVLRVGHPKRHGKRGQKSKRCYQEKTYTPEDQDAYENHYMASAHMAALLLSKISSNYAKKAFLQHIAKGMNGQMKEFNRAMLTEQLQADYIIDLPTHRPVFPGDSRDLYMADVSIVQEHRPINVFRYGEDETVKATLGVLKEAGYDFKNVHRILLQDVKTGLDVATIKPASYGGMEIEELDNEGFTPDYQYAKVLQRRFKLAQISPRLVVLGYKLQTIWRHISADLKENRNTSNMLSLSDSDISFIRL